MDADDYSRFERELANDPCNPSPLMIAAKMGLFNMCCELVVRDGVDVDAEDDDGDRAIHYAIRHAPPRAIEIIQLFVACGASTVRTLQCALDAQQITLADFVVREEYDSIECLHGVYGTVSWLIASLVYRDRILSARWCFRNGVDARGTMRRYYSGDHETHPFTDIAPSAYSGVIMLSEEMHTELLVHGDTLDGVASSVVAKSGVLSSWQAGRHPSQLEAAAAAAAVGTHLHAHVPHVVELVRRYVADTGL